MYIPRERRHWVNKKTLFCLFLFMFVFLYCIVFVFWTCIYPHAIVLHWMHVQMIICFTLLCDHYSHFHMTFLVYDQVAHMFHSIFTWLQFTCYIIRVILLLALPWGFNMFCASVSGYRYICFKFITTPMIHDRGSDMIGEEKRERVLCYINYVFALLIVHVYA